jgi:hypothetical protein
MVDRSLIQLGIDLAMSSLILETAVIEKVLGS